MTSSAKPATENKVGVKISKETGAAYADIREVIESEIARIKKESICRERSANGDGSDSHSQGQES